LDIHPARDEQALLRRGRICHGGAPTFATCRTGQVESFQHQGQLGGFNLNVGCSLGHGASEVEPTASEFLGVDTISSAVPEQNAHLVAAPIPEHEQVATERIGPEALGDKAR
jgi:hypothetical protein